MSGDSLALRYQALQQRIERACQRAGRDPAEVQLLAVSKTQPAEAVRAAYALGLRCFGENYVQELAAKASELADLPGLRWHLIGHLQRNKLRLVRRHAASLDTVDSLRLAEAICADPASGPVDVWVQVSLAGEAQKSGCTPDEADALCTRLRQHAHLQLRGLMTVPPLNDDPEAARPCFRQLRQLGQQLGLAGLSMGMSHDLEVAIEEGATLVRVGTALFGAR